MANAKAKALAVAGAAAVAASGCGSGGGTTPAGPARAAQDAPAVDLNPPVTGGELLRLQRYGGSIGTSDTAKWGGDGSAVTIQAYGGGGERIRRCTLRAGELTRLRAALRALPLKEPRPSGAAAPSPQPQYVLTAGSRVQTFTQSAMPAGARPLTRLLAATLDGRAADCRTTYRTRR